MKTEPTTTLQEKVCVTLPGELVEDLKSIASFNDMEVDKLAYSYIVDGVAHDSIIARRMKFTDKTNRVLDRHNVPSKTFEEIFSNLVY